MKVMVMMKGTDAIEAAVQPSQALMVEMMAFNEELVKAGMMLSGDGLQPSSKGKRVVFSADAAPTVYDGPFAETKELIAGYWIWEVKDMDDAMAWAVRIPNTDGLHGEVEVRPLVTFEDFENMTPEIAAKEQELRAQSEKLNG